ANQSLPEQEAGVRFARALPYELHTGAVIDATGSVALQFSNTGSAAAVFQVYSANAADAPRNYTVEAHTSLSGAWATTGDYALHVCGPNGSSRTFVGTPDGARLDVQTSYDHGDITLTIANRGPQNVNANVTDNYTGRSFSHDVSPDRSTSHHW